MKKRMLGFIVLPTLLVLASCSSLKIESITNDDDSYITNQDHTDNNNTTNNKNKELLTPSYVDTNASLKLTTNTSKETNAEDTVEKVYDSVVSISAISTSAQSSGSGVLVTYDEALGLSYLVTCFHVIDEASVFEVTLSNDETYEAELVGAYEDLDLAVLSINKLDLCYSEVFSDSSTIKLGSSVVAIGNPLGILPGSVSSGVVSYLNRKIQTDEYTTRTLIQTDVAINSGNSGGGLFNTAGALIGIVNAKYAKEGVEGLGFAIPSSDVIATFNEIINSAKYDENNKIWKQGYIDGDYEFAFTISQGYYNSGFKRTNVYYISNVVSNESYTGDELRVNDILVSIKVDYKDSDKTDTTYQISLTEDPNSWLYSLDLNVGDTLVFTVSRNNQQVDVNVSVDQFVYTI